MACLAVSLAAALYGCAENQPAKPDARLDASITQFRNDEGTRTLKAGVTNAGPDTVTVSRAALAWDGFGARTKDTRDWTLKPGESAAWAMSYDDARCDAPPGKPPMLEVEVEGSRQQLPLKVEDPGLLDRLHAKECAAKRLGKVATVSLELADQTAGRAGAEYLPGHVVLTRRPGSHERVAVVDLRGSVLLDLSRAAPLGALEPGAASYRLPVRITWGSRCDAHSLATSQQSYLFGVFVRLGSGSAQRVVTVPDQAARDRLNKLILRDCR